MAKKKQVDREYRISASSINTFLGCPLKFKFRYRDGIEGPSDSPHLLYGTAIHSAIELFHKELWQGGVISVREMQQVFMTSWELGIDFNEVPVKWYRRSTKSDMTKSGLESIKNYHRVHQKDASPPTVIGTDRKGEPFTSGAVEVFFVLPLESLTGYKKWHLSGVIDLIKLEEGKIGIIDHKTGSYPYTDFKVRTDLQLAIYAYAFRQMCDQGMFPDIAPGTKESYVMFDVISKKKPEIFYHKREISDLTINHLGYIIKTMIGQIERDEFLPNYSQECSAFGACDFLEHCGEFKFG